MLSIRLATHADIPDILPLNAIVQTWHAQHYPERFHAAPNPEDIQTFFKGILASDTHIVLIAQSDTLTTGYALLSLNTHDGSALSRPFRHMHIEHIAVAPDHQRRGIGKALIAHAENLAREKGCNAINLTSWSDNRSAHAAFEASGFAPRRFWFEKDL